MKHISGPHCIYEPSWLKPGEATHWHAHAVPHHTIALSGDVLVKLRQGEHITEHLLREGDAVRWVLAPAHVEHCVTLVDEKSRAVCFFGGRDLVLGRVRDAGVLTATVPAGTEQVSVRLVPHADNTDADVRVSLLMGGRTAAAATMPGRAEAQTIEMFGQGYSLASDHDGSEIQMNVEISGSGLWTVYWGAW
jgi:hypothetical protein